MIDSTRNSLIKRYQSFILGGDIDKNNLILDIFLYQSNNNRIYRRFIKYLGINPENIHEVKNIPFLPASFFKKHKIVSGNWHEEKIFESSSTTGMTPSQNYIRDLDFYLKNAAFCFEEKFESLKNYCFFALLPSYLERDTSSLIYMVDHFIKSSGCGGFYKYDYEKLLEDMNSYRGNKKKVLFGVTFALLQMAEKFPVDLNDVLVMETGGMKGRGKELHRDEVHNILRNKLNISTVYSEYGMTELLSQSYSTGDGLFELSKSMDILISDIYDPFSYLPEGKQGKINVIDLANIDTCSFIATDDLGIKYNNNEFKVLGRTDESDVRGCNLLFF